MYMYHCKSIFFHKNDIHNVLIKVIKNHSCDTKVAIKQVIYSPKAALASDFVVLKFLPNYFEMTVSCCKIKNSICNYYQIYVFSLQKNHYNFFHI